MSVKGANLRRNIWTLWDRHLKHLSGWGCNAQGLPTAASEEAADYHFIVKYPQCAIFRDAKPTNLDLMERIFTRPMASGAYATNTALDIVETTEDDQSLPATPAQQLQANMRKRLGDFDASSGAKRPKSTRAQDIAAAAVEAEEAMFERHAAAISAGAVGRATARLFQDVPVVKLRVNADACGQILRKLEEQAVAQAFLHLPKDMLSWYIEERVGVELFLANPEDLEASPT